MSDSEKPTGSWAERSQSIKHKWLVSIIYVEWLCEWISYLLGKWAFLDILEHVGRLTIIVAILNDMCRVSLRIWLKIRNVDVELRQVIVPGD